MREVAADLTFAGDRVVNLADPRQHQQLHVPELEPAQQHHSAGCSHSSPEVSTNVTPVARLPDLSRLILVTSQLVRAEKFDLRSSAGRIVVCGLAFE